MWVKKYCANTYFSVCGGLLCGWALTLRPMNLGYGSWGWLGLGITIGQFVHKLGSRNVEIGQGEHH